MNKPRIDIESRVMVGLHIFIWVCILASPLMFQNYNESINWRRYLMGSFFPLITCAVFYLNYLYLVPRYFIKGERREFWMINAAAIVCISLLQHFFMMAMLPPLPPKPEVPQGHQKFVFTCWFFVARNIFVLVCVTFVSLAIRLSLQWRISENARKKAEMERTAAELKNLRSQINPHFLLNTLNNIYALIEFDTEKAQSAVRQLGGLLRHVLYENQQERVSLKHEIEFLQTYIELMRIRLQQHVRITVDFNIPEQLDLKVAPLIFISLIENAFKHGVSPTAPSFINLSLTVSDDGCIHFKAVNSNFPKSRTDKAGSGIGLKQVQRRLELSYPDRFSWIHGVNEADNTYVSAIRIDPPKISHC